MTRENSVPKQHPPFANETEEANWWYDNREQHAAEFVKAAKEGRVRVTTLAERLARLRGETTLKLAPEDKIKADKFARLRGVSTEVFLETLVHDALDREPPQAA